MRRLFATAAFCAIALPACAFAQSSLSQSSPSLAPSPVPAAVATAATAATAPAPSAMVRADVAGIQQHDDAADAHTVNSAAAATGLHQGQGMALMVVGGAAIVGGLLIGNDGGTAVALGGLVVGLVGLYQYVR